MVFLHEGLGSALHWRGFPARVAAATGCGTLLYSRLGYGASENRPRPWPSTFLEEEATMMLPALLAKHHIESPVLYGHSDGGSIALLHASAFPGVAMALVVEAAHVMMEDVSAAGIAGVLRQYVEGDLRARLQKYHGDHLDDTVAGWSETWLRACRRSWDIRPALRAITAPVLVIQGRQDEHGTLAQAEAISAGIPGEVEQLILDDCGHAPHREKPEAVLEAVLRFVRHL
jgi:pimeloyl-ACP methyl ester carboxylesterase